MPPISCTECKQHPLVTRITGSNAETGSALRVALVDEDGSFNCSLGQKVVWGWVATLQTVPSLPLPVWAPGLHSQWECGPPANHSQWEWDNRQQCGPPAPTLSGSG